MRNLFLVIIAFLTVAAGQTNAQSAVSYGFKAGLNFIQLKGPAEADDNGTALESFKGSTGFHIGANINFRFTDHVGLRTELLFTQKGFNSFYEGAAQSIYKADSGNKIVLTGTASSGLSVFNNYFEVPVMFYVRPVEKIELSLGASAGVLLSSTGSGNFSFTGTAPSGLPTNFEYALDYNYVKDAPGEADFTTPTYIDAGNETLTMPSSAGAYFNSTSDEGNAFKTLDFSLNAGLAFYFNSSLYLGGRVNYGITDITNNAYDILRHKVDGNNTIQQPDKDTFLNIQASIGFNF